MDEVEQLNEMINRTPEVRLEHMLPFRYRKKIAYQAIKDCELGVRSTSSALNTKYSELELDENDELKAEDEMHLDSLSDEYFDARADFAMVVDAVQMEYNIPQRTIERLVRRAQRSLF